MTRRILCKILFIVVAVFALLALPGIVQAQGRSDQALEHAKQVQERHTDELMAKPGVVGTAVGLGQGDQPVVLVLIEHGNVPGIPEELERIPVKKVVSGKINAFFDTTTKYRPAPIGVSTGHPLITAGTIGCRVKDSSGNVYALSNNHVYAAENMAIKGDAVIQPGTYDGGSSPADDIGNLSDFEPIVFSRKASNVIDAAIAISDVGRLGNATPLEVGYGTPSSTTVKASLGLKVQKFGRTTLLTNGEVTALNATVNVGYGYGKTARFVNQIIIGPGGFSAGGDSGSLIVTDDSNLNPVGLLFAGSSSVTIANPIDAVLSRFGVIVDGETTASPPPPPPGGEATTVSVTSIGYDIAGGKSHDRNLLITVALEDNLGNPVAGASVSIGLLRNGSLDSSGTGTTGTNGTITFTRRNAPSGDYTTDVTNVAAAGLNWDGITPPNSYTKQ